MICQVLCLCTVQITSQPQTKVSHLKYSEVATLCQVEIQPNGIKPNGAFHSSKSFLSAYYYVSQA